MARSDAHSEARPPAVKRFAPLMAVVAVAWVLKKVLSRTKA
jgi:hypothetical protein